MIYTMTILDNVLDIANNFNISSNDRYIAYKLFEYCDEIEKMTLTEQIISILIAAVVTMATRFIPFLIFDQSKELSPYLEELGKFLPAAIMGVLVIYCYRNISFAEPSKALLEIVAGLVTLFIHLWKRNMPLSILVGTGFYMVMLNLF